MIAENYEIIERIINKRPDISEELFNISVWLDNALSFDVGVNSDKPKVKKALEEIYSKIEGEFWVVRKKSRTKQALQTVLLNLWQAYVCFKPIRYSRNKNDYNQGARYRKIFLKYDRLIPVIDALENRGYIIQSGFIYKKNKKSKTFGRQTRMFPTEKLIKLFEEKYEFKKFGDIKKDEPPDTIQLRKITIKRLKQKDGKTKKVKDKKDLKYTDTEDTNQWRENLTAYNNLIKKSEILLDIDNEDETVKNDFLLNNLYNGIIKGKVNLSSVNLKDYVILNNNNSSSIDINNKYYNIILDTDSRNHIITNTTTNPLSYSQSYIDNYITDITNTIINKSYIEYIYDTLSYITITKGLRNLDTVSTALIYLFFSYLLEMNKALALIKDKEQYQAVLQQERKLSELGIKRLAISLEYESLHRVFKNKFDLCGRFYGAWHMNMPSNLRKYIRINGNETTQLDYSGLHIRMLYHKIGEDYKDDPYLIGTKDERNLYKLVSLISINCDAKGACGAIKDALIKEGIKYPCNKKKPIKRLVDAFTEYHKPISEKIFTAQGDRLQNLDSKIMDGILTTLTEKGIVALPVHDEIIVETRHKELAKQVMTDEYKKIMKYEPIIDEK